MVRFGRTFVRGDRSGVNLRVRTAFVVPDQDAGEASESGVDDDATFNLIAPASGDGDKRDGAVSAADENVPTVRAVPTPSSLATAKRNAVRIQRLRPRAAGRPETRQTGFAAATSEAGFDDMSSPSDVKGGAARALSDRVDMVPGVVSIEASELSEQQARMGRLGRFLDDDMFDGRDGDLHADAGLSFLAGRSRPASLPFPEVGPVTRRVDEELRRSEIGVLNERDTPTTAAGLTVYDRRSKNDQRAQTAH